MPGGREHPFARISTTFVRILIMSLRQIVTLADAVVKGQPTRIPPMKGDEWHEFCWWLDHLRGYAM